ncbi:unnamed protein product [Dracunculus medinensis]|uniref:G_PROTEIN_RECEP_F3_4 domain-containing protein n=1 Tax=Dracunculus medinensis TaxID=318479 RepID=A0A0N4U5Q9_DRAME|nr:unnamed protein product [Dracunculus medinensis]
MLFNILIFTQLSVLIYAQDCKFHHNHRIPIALGIFLPNQYKAALGPTINLALEHIHYHSCILNNYFLSVFFKDTKCQTSLGMKALFELMNVKPRPFALFGDACTNVNEPVAMASKYWQIIHLSYAETHAKFATADSQQMYPTFFRVVPGHRNLNTARCRLIYHFNWRRVGTLKQSDDPRFALMRKLVFIFKPHEPLTTKLEHGYGIKVIYTAGVSHDEINNIANELDELKKRDVRIFIGDFDEAIAVRIMCEAYRKGLYGENYVWILPGYHSELNIALESHFSIEYAPYSPHLDQMTIANKTVGMIKEILEKACGSICFENKLKAYVYDGIWTLALAFHNVSMRYKSNHGTLYDPRLFSSNYSDIHADLLQEITSTLFEGVTGRVQFENNERLGLVEILQWRNGSYIEIGYFDGSNELFTLYQIIKTDWHAPLDATILVRQRQYISYALFIFLSLLSSIGVLLALFFLSINVRYRYHRLIKMSSPNMNNIIIVGSILTYISVVLLGFDTRFVSSQTFITLCYAKTWVLCLGFTLAFGSMFSKTWRVHSIFTNIHMNKKAIKDYKLFFFVGAVVFLDIIILIMWAFISPFSLSLIELPKIYLDNKVIAPEIERCYSENTVVFQAIIFGIKGLLMILGCFLAWETRYVNIPALNDSKYIGMSVYNVVVISTLNHKPFDLFRQINLFNLSNKLQDQVDEAYALTSFFIIFCTTLTLCLVFVPKIIELIRNPIGSEPHYRKGLVKSVIGRQNKQLSRQLSVNVYNNEKDRLQRLEEENRIWNQFLEEVSFII